MNEVERLVKCGLAHGYVTMEANDRFLKGRLLVPEQIKHNAVHKERFFAAYDLFSADRPENRLIRSALLYLKGKTRSWENAKRYGDVPVLLVYPYVRDADRIEEVQRHFKIGGVDAVSFTFFDATEPAASCRDIEMHLK